MQPLFYPKARSENLVIQTLPDETLVYDMSANEAHCLNESASFVWQSCTGEASVDDIAWSASVKFGSPMSVEMVDFALAQLDDRKLLTRSAPTGLNVVSRRTLIKKIGLASAVALPIIASLVTPTSVFAALSCGACTSPASCLSRPGCTPNCNGAGICAP